MSGIHDDFDSRPGSTTSLLRTVIGSAVRSEGGWMASAAFVALMEALDVPATRTRTALTRLKAKGLLQSSTRNGVAGWSLAPEGRGMLERGDRRIYHPRFMGDVMDWFVISFTVPEENRNLRHQLKRRLTWIGCGSVAGALWIGPGYLAEEAEQIVEDLDLVGQVTVFKVNEIRGATEPRSAIAQWWDLPAIRTLHDVFLASHADALARYRADPSDAQAFRIWIRALDAWRLIPYLDPGLAPELLPEDWPGLRSVPIFIELRDLLSDLAAAHIHAVAAQFAPD